VRATEQARGWVRGDGWMEREVDVKAERKGGKVGGRTG